MNSITIRQGARLDLLIETQSPDAVSATLVVKAEDDTITTYTQPYVASVADFSNTTVSDLPLGTYEYQVNDNYVNGPPDKYPNPDGCEGDCEFPTITICEALDTEES